MYHERTPFFNVILKDWAPLINWRSMLKLTDPSARVVAIDGAFDGLNLEHVHILSEALKMGDILVVGLHSDAYIQTFKKSRFPTCRENERKAMLDALKTVTFTHIIRDTSTLRFLIVTQPFVYVRFKDYMPLYPLDPYIRRVLDNARSKIKII